MYIVKDLTNTVVATFADTDDGLADATRMVVAGAGLYLPVDWRPRTLRERLLRK